MIVVVQAVGRDAGSASGWPSAATVSPFPNGWPTGGAVSGWGFVLLEVMVHLCTTGRFGHRVCCVGGERGGGVVDSQTLWQGGHFAALQHN